MRGLYKKETMDKNSKITAEKNERKNKRKARKLQKNRNAKKYNP